MIGHRWRATSAAEASPAREHPVELVAVLGGTVLAAMVLAVASFSGVRADPAIDS